MEITPLGACAKERRVSESVAKQYIFLVCTRGRGSGKVSTSGLEGRSFKNRYHRRSAVYGARCTPNHTQWPNAFLLVWLEEAVPAQAPSLPSDRGSKLRGPSLYCPRVASKRDVNIT
ncbi:hypothetical protein AVEN_126965-1 [Araneus ventricosus]|uniref:Uncharacterized protein n=1 Tax=Araneus ventricosus TaxID=182803 RepID=A0A4Y2EDY1_ARAVE|nr:hypothetical protein AVEN_126965-1 [Araneus ventricosus]